MFRLEVSGFQSIESASLDIDGFAVLTGRSNLGKSALVRALRYALSGATGTDFVRHSATCSRRTKSTKTCRCFCKVRLQTDTLELTWEKGDTVNRYTVNGTVYDKVERGTPEFLPFTLTPLMLGDRSVLLQVASQFHPIFLLDQSGSVVADVLSDVGRLGQLHTAIRLCESDRREASSALKVRRQDIKTCEAELASYQGLDAALQAVHEVEARSRDIRSLHQKVRTTESYLEQQARATHHVRVFQGCLDATAIHADLPTSDVYRRLDAWESEIRALVEPIRKTDAVLLATTPRQEWTDRKAYSYRRFRTWSQDLDRVHHALGPIQQAAELDLPDSERLKSRAAKWAKLRDWIHRSQTIHHEIELAEQALQSIEAGALDLQREIEGMGVCPMCGKEASVCHD